MRTLECVYRCTQISVASGYTPAQVLDARARVYIEICRTAEPTAVHVFAGKKPTPRPSPPTIRKYMHGALVRAHIADIAPVCLLGANELGCLCLLVFVAQRAAGRHSKLAGARGHGVGGFWPPADDIAADRSYAFTRSGADA